ncbi:hypothetical protein MTO96_012180 [Rhipicephalus appendiculatus]
MKALEMQELLSAATQKEELKNAECLVVILMSHGRDDIILGVDRIALHLHEVYGLFNNENCPHLTGKPKLFFTQVCLESNRDCGADTSEEDRLLMLCSPLKLPASSSSSGEKPINTWSDMYIAYASIPDWSYRRNILRGSWFFSAVFEVFRKHAGTMHLEELMQAVSAEILRNEAIHGKMKPPTVELRGWMKKLYFNPKKFVDAWPAEA